MDEVVVPEVVVPAEQQPSPEDLAAHDYKMLLPKFRDKLEPISRRQQQRVMNALIEYPFENDRPRFSYPVENELFYIGMQLLDCQFILKRACFELIKDQDKMKEFNEELAKLKEEETKEKESTHVGI
jgi:hypothetical protein